MKEDFLHYVWQYKLFSFKNLKTTKNENLVIVNSGNYNTNAGPDFLNSQIKINNQLWAGNIEIHLKSSDWYAHHHENDANYDAVILHIVWENDAEIFMKNNQLIPTLKLKGLVDKILLEKYQKLVFSKRCWIPCETQIHLVNKFVFTNWLERLYFERLEKTAILIRGLLEKSNNDYEAVLFQLLSKNFGLKINSDAFLNLAMSLKFSIIRKEQFYEQNLMALLFGQAGFLSKKIENSYHYQLKKEYEYLKHKYQLEPISKNQFQFFRMRPANFPTIRIAQLVALYYRHQNLFSKLMKTKQLDDFYSLFSVEINEFWKTHYTFEKSSKKSAKKLTKSFVDLLLINTIIPLKFVYQKSRGEAKGKEILKLMQELKPEKNSIISKFSELKINSKNAFETQALLELKNNYCTSKRCLQCMVGNELLRKNKSHKV